MGCGLSKQEEEDDVVSLCRERKRLLKLAVERRYSFADAQYKYNQSLYGVAVALRLIVSRHSSPNSPFLITFPDAQDQTHNINPTEPKLENTQKENKDEKFEEEEESGSEDDEEICHHFYDDDGPSLVEASPKGEFGWDFFYPFDEIRTELLNGFKENSDEDLKAVREKEGIPELEAVNVKIGDVGNENVGNENGGNLGHKEKELEVIDSGTKGRELLEALNDVADHFLRAYDSGLDVSRMLEANRVHFQSGLEEIKESSSKLIRSLTWNRSTSFRSSPSCRSLLSSSSTNSSRWTEFKADVFHFNVYGMKAGSHSLTLGRLYAWEKKLFEEVKAGEEMRKIYEKKCSNFRKSNTKKDEELQELHSRISVAIKSMESISNRIVKLRDEELQPQFLELLHGLMTNWKTMLQLHETQNRVMSEVKHFNLPSYGKFSNDSHRLATLQLEAELDNWRTCFDSYLSTQGSYIKALCGWLSKFVATEVELRPPLLAMCQTWLVWLDKLPNMAVTYGMKNFGKDIRALWSQQGNEQQQKRKLNRLARELEKRNRAFKRQEKRVLESKITEQETQASVRNRIEYLAEGKRLLDMFEQRLEEEKEKHIYTMKKTQQIAVSGFQTGFSSVFDSLVMFSESSVEMYADLVKCIPNAKTVDRFDTDLSYIDMIN